MRKFVVLLLLAGLVFLGWRSCAPVRHPAGVLVRHEPVQTMLDTPMPEVQRAGFTLHPLAAYTIEGRVLHTHHYFSDAVAKLAPRDVALGWGRMSDSAVLDQLQISQSNRFFFWRYQNNPPIPIEEITAHSGNHHLIPATPEIGRQIAWLRQGELIRLEGCLIEARKPSGPPWRSSLTRTDDGNGACEIMWVSKLEKITRK